MSWGQKEADKNSESDDPNLKKLNDEILTKARDMLMMARVMPQQRPTPEGTKGYEIINKDGNSSRIFATIDVIDHSRHGNVFTFTPEEGADIMHITVHTNETPPRKEPLPNPFEKIAKKITHLRKAGDSLTADSIRSLPKNSYILESSSTKYLGDNTERSSTTTFFAFPLSKAETIESEISKQISDLPSLGDFTPSRN